LAPVIPHITDTPENLGAVIRAAREAGAAKIWHNTLYLHDVTRDAFFGYVKERRPELLGTLETIYTGRYAPRSVTERIDRCFEAIARATPRRPISFIQPGQLRQISLLDR